MHTNPKDRDPKSSISHPATIPSWYHRAQSLDEFAPLAKGAGFVSYAVVNIEARIGSIIRPVIVRSDAPEVLLQAIDEIGGLGNCSVMEVLQLATVPFGWDVDHDLLTGKPHDFVDDMPNKALDAVLRRFGVVGGYCIPVCHPNGDRHAVIYVGTRHETGREYPNLVFQTIKAFDAHAHELHMSAPFRRLGALEARCLELAAENPDRGWISQKIGLSPHAVRVALDSATRKLNARSSHEASALLARHRG